MKIVLCRVDERLVHGEIVNQWLGFFKADYLVIADDELIEDAFMCLMYKALLPIWVKPQILSVPDAAEFLAAHREEDASIILLAKTPVEFLRLSEYGVPIPLLTLADKIYFPNKRKIPPEYEAALAVLKERGTVIVAQNAPEDEEIFV